MTTSFQIQQRIDAFPMMCRSAGLKVTPQRVAVFSMLVNTIEHPSPEEVYKEIRLVSPSISLATVYKILDMFHLKGFIRRVSTADQVTRYDANLEKHHHLICSSCGTIEDVSSPGHSIPEPEVVKKNGFKIVTSEIQYHGICSRCAQKN